MFNTTILDVAIGMIFVYLLLSLMCTAANEIIELALKKRAIDLERGIRELLAPGSRSGTNDIVQNLYNHSLINGLFGGLYENSRIKSAKRYVMRTALPSYIPSRTFALALMDLVLPGTAAPPAGVPSDGGAIPAQVDALSGAAGATPPPANYEVKLDGIPPPPPAPLDPNNPLARLRSAVGINALFTPQAKKALTTLIDAAGSDVAKARENIEGWYDNSMDRVSSWYKRRTQVVLIILGLFVAVTVNADSITIAKRLSTDRSLRESLVAAAQDYAKANANTMTPTPTSPPTVTTKPKGTQESPETPKTTVTPEPAGAPNTTATPNTATKSEPRETPKTTATPSSTRTPPSDSVETANDSVETAKTAATATLPPACVKDKNSAECKHEETLLKIPVCAKDRNSNECKHEERLLKVCAENKESAECKYEEKCGIDGSSPECRYQESLLKMQGLGLPIGWDATDDIYRKWPGLRLGGDGGWWDQIYFHLFGWLLTALAISLGAPFWFDLLNKFIVIRSAVKPHEKSPEEGSKD